MRPPSTISPPRHHRRLRAPATISASTIPLKRAQFAKMIVGTLDIDPGPSTNTRFTDLGTPDANGYPHTYVQIAYETGITNGTNPTQTLFSPLEHIRRDQVVTMIVRGAQRCLPRRPRPPRRVLRPLQRCRTTPRRQPPHRGIQRSAGGPHRHGPRLEGHGRRHSG